MGIVFFVGEMAGGLVLIREHRSSAARHREEE